jgi:hypothetical protein
VSASPTIVRPALRACLVIGAAVLLAVVTGCGSHGGGSTSSSVEGALTYTWAATDEPAISPSLPTHDDAVTLTGRLRCSTALTITTPVRVVVAVGGVTKLDTTVTLVLTVAQGRAVPDNLYTIDLSLPLGQLSTGTDQTLIVTVDPDNTFGSPVQNVSTKSFSFLVTVAPGANG